MLVLSRKEGEKLVIGDNITLVVSKISGNRVTLGIEAPSDVKIFRGELAREKAQQAPLSSFRRAATVTIDLDEIAEAQARNFGLGEQVEEECNRFAVDAV